MANRKPSELPSTTGKPILRPHPIPRPRRKRFANPVIPYQFPGIPQFQKFRVLRGTNNQSIAMQNIRYQSLLLLVITSTLVATNGCQQDPVAQKEKFIADMITGFGKQKKDVLERAQGVYADVRVFRDGKLDVVVFERKLAEGYETINPQLKSLLVAEMKSSEASLKALKLGIQIRMIDRTNEGKVVSDFTISESDL